MTAAESPVIPPAYNLLRFEENYSCLTNPVSHTEWLDAVKYIPIRGSDPLWYVTFGGELRERFEGSYDPYFGTHAAEPSSYWLQRITFLGDLHLGERLRIFAEGISGLMEGKSGPAPPTQRDPIDLQFAFIDAIPYMTADARLTLRAGRFGMSLGSGRLVATRAGPNIPFRFDGFEALYSRPEWNVTGFVTQPVKDTGEINGEDHSVTFWGLYATRLFDAAGKPGLDLYYFGIDREHGVYASGRGHETRHSLGLREFGRWSPWDWNAEEVLQLGSFGSESILAWTASLDLGYTFQTELFPRLGLKVDVTSGDRDPHDGWQGTFDALYFKSGYFNDASLIRPQNVIDVHPNVGLKFTQKLSVDGGVDSFWRYARQDAVYAVPGFAVLPPNSTAPSYVSTAADFNLTWQLQRHLTFQASYVHFFTGAYLRLSGGKDMDFISTTLSFLF